MVAVHQPVSRHVGTERLPSGVSALRRLRDSRRLRDGEAFTFLLALIIVVETTKGTFAFETYDSEAPKTVAHVVDLVPDGFYDGQRIHRAAPRFVVQWGDPRS
ncbi:MAG: hypothetical protein DMG01_24835, partial [Acidobacteria bacterium]